MGLFKISSHNNQRHLGWNSGGEKGVILQPSLARSEDLEQEQVHREPPPADYSPAVSLQTAKCATASCRQDASSDSSEPSNDSAPPAVGRSLEILLHIAAKRKRLRAFAETLRRQHSQMRYKLPTGISNSINRFFLKP